MGSLYVPGETYANSTIRSRPKCSSMTLWIFCSRAGFEYVEISDCASRNPGEAMSNGQSAAGRWIAWNCKRDCRGALKVNLSAYESRVLWFIFSKNNGFKKTKDWIALSRFSKSSLLIGD